jgi:hypothetical protein
MKCLIGVFGRLGCDAALPGKWRLKEAVGALFTSKIDSMTRFHSVRNTRHILRRNVMTYGCKPHNSITSLYQQVLT